MYVCMYIYIYIYIHSRLNRPSFKTGKVTQRCSALLTNLRANLPSLRGLLSLGCYK